MATSVEEYVSKELTGATVKDDGKEVKVTLNSGASGKLDDTSVKRDWVITGTSNGNVNLIATGSGNDKISLAGSIGGATVNVGSGKDSVIIGKGGFINTSLIGGEGDKTVVVEGDIDPSYISLSGSNVNGTGNDEISVKGSVLDSTIDAGAGRDTIYVGNGTTGDVKNSIIRTGADNDYVTIAGDVSASTIDLGADRDSLNVVGKVEDSTIDGGDDFDVITIGGAVSNSKISLGAGKDTLSVGGAVVDTSIYGGADADAVTLSGATYSYVDLGDGADVISLTTGTYGDVNIALGAGKDTIDARAINGKVSITDYNVLEDVVVGVTAAGYGASGDVSVGTGVVNVSKTGEFYAVNTNGSDYYAWGDEDGSRIDIRDWTKATTIDGRANGDAADLVIGGKKADTIYAGANDSVYGGAGNDTISIVGTDTQEFVGLSSAGGRDSVAGFQTKSTTANKSADEADVLYLYEDGLSSLKMETVTGGALVAKVGNGSVQLRGMALSEETFNVMDNNSTVAEVNFVTGTATVPAATDEFADYYYAGSSTASLDFSNVDSELVVDLGNRNLNVNGTSLINTDNAFYYGKFAAATGGKDNTVLIGAADAKETLTAGTGDTTIWGGGKKADSLSHGAGISNSVTFFFGEGDGADTINSSNWGNGDTADVLWLGATAKTIKNDGSTTAITMKDGSKATLNFAASDTAIKFTTDGSTIQQAKIGTSSGNNTWTYDEGVSFYMGGKKNTLNVNSSVDEANIWLDGSNGKHYEGVSVVNAGSNTGAVTLAGSAASESLVAGTGTSSLWGGVGNTNDTLTGNSTGNTTFFFGKGEGKDVITNSNSDDKVVLYNAVIGDVAGYDDSKSGVLAINMKDGSSLTVNNVSSGSVNTFQLSDGSVWKYDASTTDKWVKG